MTETLSSALKDPKLHISEAGGEICRTANLGAAFEGTDSVLLLCLPLVAPEPRAPACCCWRPLCRHLLTGLPHG